MEVRTEKMMRVDDLLEFMRSEGLVFAKREDLERESLQRKYLRKKSLSFKEIADARIWGIPSKTGVKAIADREIMEHEIFKRKNAHYIVRSAVERIAKNRGVI